ncbi:MAG: nodulation protein NfeD [Anaerolineaceae bacterium]|nr:nodulation protein NfeD [Anaerolineaceae bacterium]
MRRMLRYWLFLQVVISFLLLSPQKPVQAQDDDNSNVIVVLTSEGPITPILTQYLERGLRTAEELNAELVILELDTPGGSVDIMNEIVQLIRRSDVPVVVFVSPSNAMAGSAGTVITLAGHVAAMAPETTIGAASPVGGQGEDIGETMESKVKEILKASVRGLTSNRSPEAIELAQETIENAIAVTADEAFEVGLIDIRASDLSDLIDQLDGYTVIIKEEEVVLNTRNAEIINVSVTFIEDVLLLLINPNLVFILLSVGVQAILIELSSPGGWVAGFIGAVCLLLAVYGMGLLPVNWFGLLFIVIAFVLFILEVKAPTHGALIVAGVISFIVGALALFNSANIPGMPRISVPLVIGTGIFLAFSFLTIVTFALRAQRAPVLVGREALPGKTGFVETELNPRGTVQVAGEYWIAEVDEGELHLPADTRVEVVSVEGLRLKVKKKE